MKNNFENMYSHGFVRLAACIPSLRVSDPIYNAAKTIELSQEAYKHKAVLSIFPELGISAYSNEDLFFHDALQQSVTEALQILLNASVSMDMVITVGAPLRVMDALYNCAVVIHKGKILGIPVKSYLPNYREFYEKRHFKPASSLFTDKIDLLGDKDIPIGNDLIFKAEKIKDFSFFCEICEDLWVPIPPSCCASVRGATIIANLSASNVTTGKAEYRKALVLNQSARCISGYLYTAAGPGESTTDMAWDGHAIISENGELLSESERFSWEPRVITADIDLDRIIKDRMTMTTYSEAVSADTTKTSFRYVKIPLGIPSENTIPVREISRFPYVPVNQEARGRRSAEVYNIQVQGLAKRIISTKTKNLVIGVSGGLDSTHALTVCAKTMDLLRMPRCNIKAFTLPGFATSEKTAENARKLMALLGVDARQIDIRESCMQMFRDIRHPYAEGTEQYDTTFENVQAGQRTSLLFRLANQMQGLVVGTGDLSELSLGWCTYGVGDHMSHYNVNASLPKTLIQYIIRWTAETETIGQNVSSTLLEILNTEISPELVPVNGSKKLLQSTEDAIGPYELQDFNLFYCLRYGFLPSKIAFMAWCAWHDKEKGQWPNVPYENRHQYDISEIKHWLGIFIHRFYKISQFKRSCVPNGPKVGSGGSLSPRSDYRAPSDNEETPWIEDMLNIPDHM